MPRLTGDMETVKLGGSFSFSGTRVDSLGASEYALGTIAVDVSGSVLGFKRQLRDMLIMSVESCKKSPRKENMLLRVIFFSDMFPSGVKEIHGFKPVLDIDPNTYPDIETGGNTPLNDACYSSIGALNAYAKKLVDQRFGVNGTCFIITDGAENASSATPTMVKDELEKAISGEVLESLVSILIGVNAANYQTVLEDFQREAGITHYRDAGAATPQNLAKVAGFVSQSFSSQSRAIGTGGPSQNIAPTI